MVILLAVIFVLCLIFGGSNTTPGEDPEEGEDIMNVLNTIDGTDDTYDGYGGTEEEIIAVLDDILGNN